MKKLLFAAPLFIIAISVVLSGCDSYEAPVTGATDEGSTLAVAGKTYDDFNFVNVQQSGFTVSLALPSGHKFGDPLARYVYTINPGPNTDGIEHFAMQYGECAGPGYSSPADAEANGPNTPSSTSLDGKFAADWPGTVLQWRFPQNDQTATRQVILDVASEPFVGWGYFELKRGGGEILTAKILVPCMNTRTETFSVYQDVNRDDIPDANEPGIPGFTLNLLDGDDLDVVGDATGATVASEVSGADGVVTFTGVLDPGEYVVEVPTDVAGVNADLLDDYLAIGSTSGSTTTVGPFGFDLSKILGKVFVDPQQGDNTVPDFEVGIPDVTVHATLQGCTDDCTYAARTGLDGLYTINNLPAGTYDVTIPASTPDDTGDFNEDLDFFFNPTFPAPSYSHEVTVSAQTTDPACGSDPLDAGKSCDNDFGFNADGGTINQVIDQADANGDLSTADFKTWLGLARQMCNKGGTIITDPAIPGGTYVLQDLLDDINAFAYSDIPEPMTGACGLKERLDRPINNFLIELEVAITVAELNYFLPGFDLCYNGNCDPSFVRAILQNAEAEYIERREAFLAAKPESCGTTCTTLTNYSGGGGGGGTGFE